MGGAAARRLGARAAALVLAVAACTSGGRERARPTAAAGPADATGRSPEPGRARAPTYLKGQLHLHSEASGDSDTPVADVVRWYADAGFDFIVFTDHNRITEAAGAGELLVFPGVELTQNLEACEPPPEDGLQCLLHVNALFVDPARGDLLVSRPLPASLRRVDRYRFAAELSGDLGGLALLNHPNFHYGADAAVLGAVAGALADAGRGPLLLEVANMAVDSNNEGDAEHPSTGALWDQVLSAGHRVYGVATDDAHHYFDAAERRARGEEVFVGDRGFVMVRASRDAAAIRAALAVGDFYASDGLLLERVEVRDGALEVAVDAAAPAPVRIRFIGGGGRVLREVEGHAARLDLGAGAGAYVRAEIVDARGARAWVQPVWPGA